MREVDHLQAAAESRLDRVDADRDEVIGQSQPEHEGVQTDDYGFHEDDPDVDLLEDDLDAGLRDDDEATAIDAVAEAFNARDLDRLLEIIAADGEAPGMLGYDRANLPGAVEDLWHQRPTVCLTRGRAETEHVGVLWEHDGDDWWRLAVAHVDDVRDGRIGVVEFSEDAALLDRVECEPPHNDELDEGARWSEWDEGDDGT
jgi:hypothetical protein